MTDILPTEDVYRPRRVSVSRFEPVRGLRYHLRCWAPEPAASADAGAPSGSASPTVVMLHGWMDVSASFQFVVDLVPAHWRIVAPDWRGFGLTQRTAADSYWFPDYLADLDRLLEYISPDGAPVDLVGHSMGANVAVLYSGLRPERVRRLVNLDGVGMQGADASQAPQRYRDWMDQVRAGPVPLRDYDSLESVAQRLMKNNPRLSAAFARFLAPHWAERTAVGRFAPTGDPAHRLPNPVLYRLDEILAVWSEVRADVLWVMAEHGHADRPYVQEPAYAERLARIRSLRRATVHGAGHMLHHDRPDAVAELLKEFLS